MARVPNSAITRFIIDQVDTHQADIAAAVIARFGVTRATASNYVRRLVQSGVLDASGQTRGKRYRLKELDKASGIESITPETQDDDVWRREILPHFAAAPANITAICAYGFTEMFNNVIDHADSDKSIWLFARNASIISMQIRDYGVGIFEKIQKSCGLADHRQALFELSKGKLTTDHRRHTGEGIFFTSRMFDYFSVVSADIFYSRRVDDDHQWLIDWQPTTERLPGTHIVMEIAVNSARKIEEVFSQYETTDAGFSKTSISLTLARYALDQLISRSQGKRLMARLEGFREVILDFEGVESVGQGFADEVFRVFVLDHPTVLLIPVNMKPTVKGMVDRARQNRPTTGALTAFPRPNG